MLELLETVRQCAWCWLVVDDTGRYGLQPGRKIAYATHGICPTCKDGLWAEMRSDSVAVTREPVAA